MFKVKNKDTRMISMVRPNVVSSINHFTKTFQKHCQGEISITIVKKVMNPPTFKM